MKKTLLSFVAVASITVAMSGQKTSAQEIKVQKGDTLWGISQKYDTSVENIKRLNNLDSDTIIENTNLVVKKEETPTYKVQKGDSLWKISVAKNVSINELRSWNQLNSDVIHPGQVLKLAGDGSAASTNTAQPAQPAQTEKAKQPKQTTQTTTKKATAVQKTSTTTKESTGKTITVSATAYTANCNGCSGTTATGVNLKANPDAKVIAVDPSVIPLGSKVYVEGYGYATAADTGGAIKGNKIDVFVPSHDQAMQWGRKTVEVQVLN